MELAKRLRTATKEEAIENYQTLKDLPCSDISKFSRAGLACLDYFFLQHRIKVKTRRRGLSFLEASKDPNVMKEMNDLSKRVRGKNLSSLSPDERLRIRYNLFQLYYGSINQFRPAEAKRLYCKFNAKKGILDFSAGWGGRCLAAMSLGIPYIGIDANTNLKKSYESMIQTVDPDAKVTLLFQPSETVDFSNYTYDLVFTSPPYFTLEEYEKMPDYGSEEGFLEKFFRPVVLAAWKHLKSPGTMALNMPKEMYDGVKDLLPPLSSRYQLPVMSRHPSNAATGRTIGTKDTKSRSEGIYVWRKGTTKTRKVKR
jgi:hypothetical protein